jgi:hypothetical protein
MSSQSSRFKSEPVKKPAGKAFVAFTLVSYLAYSSTLKMEATCSFEVTFHEYFQRSTRHYIPEDNHHCENLKSYLIQESVFIRPVQSED